MAFIACQRALCRTDSTSFCLCAPLSTKLAPRIITSETAYRLSISPILSQINISSPAAGICCLLRQGGWPKVADICLPRSGWRGAIISRAFFSSSSVLQAEWISTSSPSWVELARMTMRPEAASANSAVSTRSVSSCCGGNYVVANFRINEISCFW